MKHDFKTMEGEHCRATLDPATRQWYAHSLDKPFRTTPKYDFLSAAIMAAMGGEWITLTESHR